MCCNAFKYFSSRPDFNGIKNNTGNDYIFYPAHYSAHKNHFTILKAIKFLKEKNKIIKFVFCGHDKGNLNYLIQLSKKLEIYNQIKFNRFETKEKLYAYFLNSRAILFMSLFGPVNILVRSLAL